ncbi:MAG: hypothetical protein ABL907_11525, partial [Hyphomicrobium sp.]
MLFGWRKRNEGFEWHEYVRTTILVRRADREKRLDDARLAALAKVKDARNRGVEAGLKQVDAVRGGAASVLHRSGQALASAAKALAAAAGRVLRTVAHAVRNGLASVPRPVLPPRLSGAGSTFAMYTSDIPRRWRLAKPYVLPAAGAAAVLFVFGSALTPQPSGVHTADAAAGSAASQGKPPAPATASASDGIVSGRASAVTGDLLRVSGRLVRLAGIDAPQ